jgi:hypothetical protein
MTPGSRDRVSGARFLVVGQCAPLPTSRLPGFILLLLGEIRDSSRCLVGYDFRLTEIAQRCAFAQRHKELSVGMRRRIFNIASAVSLLLCVATVGLWIRSYYRSDTIYISFGMDRPLFGIVSGRGMFLLFIHERYGWEAGLRVLISSDHVTIEWLHKNLNLGDVYFFRGGFGFLRAYSHRTWAIAFLCWIVLLPLVAWQFRDSLRHVRGNAAKWSCETCGYNLTGNASGVCPECGTPVALKSKTATCARDATSMN